MRRRWLLVTRPQPCGHHSCHQSSPGQLESPPRPGATFYPLPSGVPGLPHRGPPILESAMHYNGYSVTEIQVERFWRRVQICSPDECWEWLSATDRDGYGAYVVQRPDGKAQNVRAHRFALASHLGEIAKGELVMHACDNPRCCNPAHLRLGTQRENQRDKTARGRGNFGQGEQSGNSRFTEADVLQMRRMRFIEGMRYEEIASKFSCSRSTAYKNCNTRWRHLPPHG